MVEHPLAAARSRGCKAIAGGRSGRPLQSAHGMSTSRSARTGEGAARRGRLDGGTRQGAGSSRAGNARSTSPPADRDKALRRA
eukprot:14066963-Alexandrium_andersonii.AAC.1